MTPHANSERGTFRLEHCLHADPQRETWRARGPRGIADIHIALDAHGQSLLNADHRRLTELRESGVLRVLDRGEDWLAVEPFSGVPIDVWWTQATGPDRWKRRVNLLSRALGVVGRLHDRGWVLRSFGPTAVHVDAADRLRILVSETAQQAPDTHALAEERAACGRLLLDLAGLAPDALAHPSAEASAADAPPHLWVEIGRALCTETPSRRPALREVAAALALAPHSPPWRPVFGMHQERAEIRDVIRRARSGEPVTVVVCGTPGSGRSTLIRDAEAFARREGVSIHPSADAGTPRGVTLLRTTVPMPQLGDRAVHLLPRPLDRASVKAWCAWEGLTEADARAVWACSEGHPGSIAAWIAAHHGHRPDASLLAWRVLDRVATRGATLLSALAEDERKPANAVIDAIEPFLAAGFLAASEDGRHVLPTERSLPLYR